MPPILPVTQADHFLDWRTKTNELIDTLNMPTLGNVVQLGTRVETFNITESAGVHIGCLVTDNGDGTVAISAGEAILRTSNLASAPLVAVEFPAVASLLLTDTTTNFIYANYNSGTPVIQFSTLQGDVNDTDRGMIAIVQKNGLKQTILQIAGDAGDFERRITHRLRSAEGFSKAFGADMSEPSALRLALSAGKFYYGVSEFPTPYINTSTVGTSTGTSTGGSTTTLIDTTKNFVTEGVQIGDQIWNLTDGEKVQVGSISTTTNPNDTLNFDFAAVTTMALKQYDVTNADFEYYHNDGTWIETGATGISNTHWNSFGVGLVAHTASYYKVDWVYLKIGTNSVTPYVLRGIAEYSSLASAQGETPPQVKPYPLAVLGVHIGRLITQQGNPNIVSVDNLLNSQSFSALGSTEFTDDTFRITDNGDTTKKLGFELSGLTTGTERIINVPNKTGTLAMIDDTSRHHDETHLHASMGMLDKRIIPYAMPVSYGASEDNTSVYVNGVAIDYLNKDEIGTINLIANDVIESNNPLCVKDAADGHQITPMSAPGTYFAVYTNRLSPHKFYLFSRYTDGTVLITKDHTNFAAPDFTVSLHSGEFVEFIISDDNLGHRYFFKSDVPILLMKDGTGGDAMSIFPMSREIIAPSIAPKSIVSIDGAPVKNIGNGYYTCDSVCSVFANADGAGTNGIVGMPVAMLGDTYMINHDIAGYQLVAVEPTIVAVYGSDNKFIEHDLTLASKSNPLKVSYGNLASGVNGVVPSLTPTLALLKYDTRSSVALFTLGETITGTTSGTTAVIAEDKGDMLILNNIAGTGFVLGEVITGGVSLITAVTTTPQYRTWHFKGSAPFCLRTNDPADDEYLAIGFEASKRLPSGITDQLARKLDNVETELTTRAPFISNFNPDLDYEWKTLSGLGVLTNIDSSTVVGASGSNVRSISGHRYDIYSEKIPFNVETLYKVSAKFRMTVSPSIPGNATVNVGVVGYDSSGIVMVNQYGVASPNSQFVGIAANARNLETDGINVWVVAEGYFRGHGTYIPNAIDAKVPSGLHANVRFFKPALEVNGVGDGTTEIDWIKVEAINILPAQARGGGSDKVFWENDAVITSNYAITPGKNAMSAGPITINNGVTVTVPAGSTWTVI